MNQGAELPTDVCDLLREQVTSLEQLETILLLRQAAPRQWCVSEIATTVRVPENLIEFALQCLVLACLVTEQGTGGPARYSYAPQTEQLDRAVAALALTYAEHPSLTIRLLSRNAIERVRSSAGRAFADAFVIRKRNKDG